MKASQLVLLLDQMLDWLKVLPLDQMLDWLMVQKKEMLSENA